MIPCHNCISFATCNARLKATVYHSVADTLIPHCSLIREYAFVGMDLISLDAMIYSPTKLDTIRHYFYHYKEMTDVRLINTM